jgi:23S rRNA (guanosine2251-2'-O)-methyltransferase
VSGALVFGLHAVRAVLARRPRDVLRLSIAAARDDARVRDLRSLAAAQGITAIPASVEALDRETGGASHQGVLAEVRPSTPLNENTLLDLLTAAAEPALVLVLDGVSDPHNLGACLRTADAAGATAVVAPRDRAAGLTAAVRKVAAGAAETVPFAQVTNLARALRDMKQAGLWIAGMAEDGDRDLFEASLDGPLAIVMGSEGGGLRRLTQECCDFRLRLPMHGSVASLNVSVAAGIALYEALRQRRPKLAKPEPVR